MKEQDYLLSDETVQDFIRNSFVQVKTELPGEVHHAAHEKTKKAFGPIVDFETDRLYNPGNNILPMVPELMAVMEDPNVVGALTSLFGDNYVVHPHRHCHPNFPVPDEDPRTTIMGIHKDGHADGNPKPRHRVPRWALVFYNPHPCPVTLGPTCISPGSHYYHRITDHGQRERNVPVIPDNGSFRLPDNYVHTNFVPVTSELGTVSILHFDTVHSVITNISDMHRYAHKFVVMRTEDPTGPSWNAKGVTWANPGDHVDRNHEIMWTFMWNWMNGNRDLYAGSHSPRTDVSELIRHLGDADEKRRLYAANELGFTGRDAASAVDALIECLSDPADSVRLNATYALGAIGSPAVKPLLNHIAKEKDFYDAQPVVNVSEAVHALIAIGDEAVDGIIERLDWGEEHERAWAAFALGDIGNVASRSVPSLIQRLEDGSINVQRHVISALGIIGRSEKRVEEVLLDVFTTSSEYDLRIYALQGLIRLNASGKDTQSALQTALNDERPYIAAFAAEQLYRIRSAESADPLIDYLRPLRWFPYNRH